MYITIGDVGKLVKQSVTVSHARLFSNCDIPSHSLLRTHLVYLPAKYTMYQQTIKTLPHSFLRFTLTIMLYIQWFEEVR